MGAGLNVKVSLALANLFVIEVHCMCICTGAQIFCKRFVFYALVTCINCMLIYLTHLLSCNIQVCFYFMKWFLQSC